MLTAVELFAGGGGLALGLRRAGIRPVSAVECDAYAAATFRANHPGVNLIEKDVRLVTSQDLKQGMDAVIDILAACPPCQGFTSLTSKYKRNDERNDLVSEVSRVAKDLRPRAIMMENVPGLASRGKPLLDELITALQSDGYVVNWDILQVADFGVPQMRRRLVLLAGRGFSVPMPEPTHDKTGRRGLPSWRT